MADQRLKNSVGIWGFGAAATRFMPGGYHPDANSTGVLEWTHRAVDGLGEWLDGLEFHYPGEINEHNYVKIQEVCGKNIDVYCLALGLFSNPRYALGSFINPDPGIRAETIEIACRGVDLAAELGSRFIIWPGGEGYNYPFQINPADSWSWFIDGIAQVTAHAASKGVIVLLEHKNSEPAMKILMRDIGMTLYTIQKVAQKGVDTSRLLINMDWQHLIMNGEPLAEYAALLMAEKKLGHHHANSGWGAFDDDNMVGALCFMETLALAVELRLGDYAAGGHRIGFDLFPYTEDAVRAVKLSIQAWEWIWDLAMRIDREKLLEARSKSDAVSAYQAVLAAMGMDDRYLSDLKKRRK